MYGKVKLTKRQIKEDKFTTFMLNAKHQFLEHWQYFIIGIAAVILIAVAIVYYFNSQAARQQEAAQRLSRAILDYRAGNSEVALLDLNEILNDYAGSEIADHATFLLAKMNYDAHNYPEALRYYEMYVNQYKDNPLRRASAMGGIAACYENQRSIHESAKRFAAAIEAYPDSPLEADYRMSALRNFLIAGDVEAARIQYEAILEKYPNTELEKRAIRLFHELTSS
jgi:outer membrane protein assembly factor BamD (BamD/ComL family)